MDSENVMSRWLIEDSQSGETALGCYTEPGYTVELTGDWLQRDGNFDDGTDLRVIRAKYRDLDTDETDDVLIFGSGIAYLAIDIEGDTSMDSIIIEHLAQDLKARDLTNGLKIGPKSYTEDQIRKIAEI